MGKTVEEILSRDKQYLAWVAETFQDGDLKKAAQTALESLAFKEMLRKKQGDYIKISIIPHKRFACGILKIDASSQYMEDIETMHPSCREFDYESECWFVPVALFGDLVKKYPSIRVTKELKLMTSWTIPDPIETENYMSWRNIKNNALVAMKESRKK
jgi:hypothetical protein